MRGMDRQAGWGLLLFGVALVVGCSTEEPLQTPERAGDADSDRRRVGSLLAEFEQSESGAEPNVQIHAQFLDARGIETGHALRALEVWKADTELDRDACSLREGQPSGGVVGDRSNLQLDLLSVGPITVDGPQRQLRLNARRLPDLVPAFSGVIYGADQRLDRDPGSLVDYQPGARYRFRAPGGQTTGGFDVTIEAPEPIALEPANGTWQHDREVVQLARGRAFDLRWDVPMRTDGEVFLEIAAGYGPGRPRLTCRLEDDGRFDLPAEIVGQLGADSPRLNVALRRVSTEQVDIAGLEQSDFTVSAVDRLTLELLR